MVTGIGAQLFSSVDRLAVGNVLGLSYVTYYSVGTSIAKKLFQMAAAISHSLMPATSEVSAVKRRESLRHLFWGGIGMVTVFSFLPGILLMVISRPFLQLWMGTDFMNHSLPMFRILILAYALMSFNAPAYYMSYGMGAPWICALGTITGGLLTISLIFGFGRIWSLNGVALANFGYITTYITTAYLLLRMKSHSVSSP